MLQPDKNRWWYVVKKAFKPAASYHRFTFERGYALQCRSHAPAKYPEKLRLSHMFRDWDYCTNQMHAQSKPGVFTKEISQEKLFSEYLWGPYSDETMRQGIWYFSGVLGPGNDTNFSLREAGQICSWSWTDEGLLKASLLRDPKILPVLHGDECLTWARISETAAGNDFRIAPVIKASAPAAVS